MRIRSFIPLLALTLTPAAGSAAAEGAARTVRDMSGAEVTIPAHPAHIADLWFAHNEVTAMLGAADRIVVTVDRPQDQPWLFVFAPALRRARYTAPAAVDPEALLADGTDVAFVHGGPNQSGALRQAGIPVLDMSFHDAAGLRRSVALTADALDDGTARARADSFLRLLDGETAAIGLRLSGVPEEKKPRVLHLASVSPLTVDGRDTIIDEWIRAGGGRNAAQGVSGPKRGTSMEQILAWDPDIIIIQAGDRTLEQGGAPQGWENLRAVREGHAVANPLGVFPWDRYGSEFVLQIRWAAGLFHPRLFPRQELRDRMSAFYATFFGHRLTEAEAEAMLAGRPPPRTPLTP